jgi:hypothetical protein
MESVLQLRKSGKFPEALRTAIICLRLHPLDWYYYKPLIYSMFPTKLITAYRAGKDKENSKKLHQNSSNQTKLANT